MIKILLILLLSLQVVASEKPESWNDQFIDPLDGRLDMSEWLLENLVGFFPVPVVITEPAIGYGGGLALLFFQPQKNDKGERLKHEVPDMYALFGIITETDSWMGGAGYRLHFKDDTIRYSGYVFKGRFNLMWYGNYSHLPSDFYLDYQVKSVGISQKIDFRLPNSNFFLGASFNYFSNESKFFINEAELPSNGILSSELDIDNSYLTPIITYDSRDSTFTPSSGIYSTLKYEIHDKVFGSSVDYGQLNFFFTGFIPFNDKFVLGTFISSKNVLSGKAPFYAQPNIMLRGVPMNRYLGKNSFTTELELRYDVVKRWSFLGFWGGGTVYDNESRFFNTKNVTSYGIGFRYLIARLMKARAGMDFARSEDGDNAIYLTFGSAWNDF